jgi:NCAIR mutase (PurE)-related protein
MNDIEKVLEQYKQGKLSRSDAAAQLQKNDDILNLGFARIDLQRQKRCGFPEVVYCAGKTVNQSVQILSQLMSEYDNVIGTRASRDIYELLRLDFPDSQYDELAHLIYQHNDRTIRNGERIISVITAGTSDIPIAEEAALTAEIMGNKVQRIYDVGVAGLHRLLYRRYPSCQCLYCCCRYGGSIGQRHRRPCR